jgi:transposase
LTNRAWKGWRAGTEAVSRGARRRRCTARAAEALGWLDSLVGTQAGRGAGRQQIDGASHPWDAIAVRGAQCEDRSGEGKTACRHTSQEFVAFLTELVAKAKWAREVHIVLDNLSAHKTEAVEQLLSEHPKVRFHFTPTYWSWLNQVELWFAKIERDVIARGVFTSVGDLRRKLMRYIRAYAKRAPSAGPTPILSGGLSPSESLGRPTSRGGSSRPVLMFTAQGLEHQSVAPSVEIGERANSIVAARITPAILSIGYSSLDRLFLGRENTTNGGMARRTRSTT